MSSRKGLPYGAPLIDRIMLYTDRSGECWTWTGAVDKTNGYGRLQVGGRSGSSQWAHRVAYEAFVGPIPAGLHIDHLCRVKACVRPEHLEPVTPAENNRRAAAARRAAA